MSKVLKVSHMMAGVRLVAIALVMAVGLLMADSPCALSQYAGPDWEKTYEKQYQWIMYCDMDVLNQYLNYKGSTMNPIVRYAVSFRKTLPYTRYRGQQSPPGIRYEELWYHNATAVGLKRYNDIFPGGLEQGAVYFRCFDENENLCQYDREMTGCAVRLVMDIYAKRSILAGVLVPSSCFDNVANDLALFNFFPFQEAVAGQGQNMSLHLIGYPKGSNQDRYFFYNDQN